MLEMKNMEDMVPPKVKCITEENSTHGDCNRDRQWPKQGYVDRAFQM